MKTNQPTPHAHKTCIFHKTQPPHPLNPSICAAMSAAGEVLRQSFPESQLHVLAVDDSVTDRKVIERLLKVSSFKVTAVDSGTRALQFLGLDGQKDSAAGYDGLKVNLIMTDYSMPGMSGYELLKKIKESSALREIPVVIMSSEKIITRIDRCLQEGAEEFIVKPVKLSDVKRLKDFVMRVEVEENSENDKWKRLEGEEENREGTIMHKRKSQQEGDSLLPCSPQSSLLLRGSDPVSPHQQPSSIPQCCCKQPRLRSMD